jgi:flagellin
LTITANSSSLDPIRALRSARLSLERSVARLSSGQRVTAAGDDAAGLAISEDVKATIRSRNQARRNIGDGISALQIADGAMVEIGDMLIRMRELALQSANGTYGTGERAMLQQEVAHLVRGVEETTLRCEFNGIHLLHGKLVDVGFVIDVSGSMGGEIAQVQASIDAFYQSFAEAGISVSFGLVEAGRDSDRTDRTADMGDAGFASALAGIVMNGGGQDPYSTLYNASGINDTPGSLEPDALTWRSMAHKRIVYLTDTGREVDVLGFPGTDAEVEANLASALASREIAVDFICRPANFSVFDDIAAATGGNVYSIGDGSGSNVPTVMGQIAALVQHELDNGEGGISIQAGPGEADRIDLDIPLDTTPRTLGIGDLDVSTVAGSLAALAAIDGAMHKLAEARAKVGAQANALEQALEVQAHHLHAEQSTNARIRDADVAEEASELARAQIITQSATAMTAQLQRLKSGTIMQLVESGRG